MTTLIKSVAVLLALASVCLADGFTGDTERTEQQPTIEPFVGEKAELFRFSRSAPAKSPRQLAKYVQQHQQQQEAENDQVSRQQVEQIRNDQNEQQQQQQLVVANELPAFSSGSGAMKTVKVTTSDAAEAAGSGQQQQQEQQQRKSSASSSSSSVSSSYAKKSTTGPLSKTITTTTTTTTTQNNQDQPQVAQIKEIRVHTVPLSEAVHYANYMVVPTSSGGSSRAAHLEESSSSSHKSSSSSTSETEQVAVAPAPTVVVDPPPAAVAPDCVFHRLVVERPVSSQLVVNVAPEVKVSHSSSSSHSSKIVSQSAVAAPESTVYSVRRVFVPPPVYSARIVQVPAPSPAVKEEHFRSESRSSREESHGLGHSVSSSSSSSSSRSSKSSSTTTSQTAALVQPPPPPPQVRTVTIVRQAAPLVAAPLVEVHRSSAGGSTSDVSVDHRQSGPNYNYGYSIKQHSSEPAATKGVVVGDRVVYLK